MHASGSTEGGMPFRYQPVVGTVKSEVAQQLGLSPNVQGSHRIVQTLQAFFLKLIAFAGERTGDTDTHLHVKQYL